MDYTQWGPLIAFAFVSTFSPGPNNIMLMTSGANVGFIRTIPHMLGVTLGFSIMVLLVGIGLTDLFQRYPWMQHGLHIACSGYLIYLAFKIAFSSPTQAKQDYQPMSFLSAVLFQWVNPKGWSMALTAVSVFNPSASWLQLMVIALVFIMVNIPSVSVWAAAGKQLSYWMNDSRYVRWFNGIMGGLLLLSVLPML
ncbi:MULTISPECIES: LysE family translocator [unclassified Vibrio]|uniref:LysE family translocator n=1 Tax=unclassified Vibrio TaxID=2614977 RepID=UPI0014822613|nr:MULTISPECIES: LysE family translocator [unclassified Vibrio]NNN44862.1 LysE family translocator [Vibrio sp. 1-1(7)]NNN72235.1 LysE family translocator [Vibrio sp. 12-2(3-a)]